MSIKTSFVHSMKWTRGMLPVVFEELGVFFIFDLFIYFFVTFFFSLSLSISKKSTLAKFEQLQPPPFPRFLRAWLFLSTFFRRFIVFSICRPLQFLKVDSPSFLYKPRFFVLYCIAVLINLIKKYYKFMHLCAIVGIHWNIKQFTSFFSSTFFLDLKVTIYGSSI